MRAFACPVCRGFAAFESVRCSNCRAELGFHLPSLAMIAVGEGFADIGGRRWVRCTKHGSLRCNWLVPEEQGEGYRGRCLADSLIRREPQPDDTIAVEKLVSTTVALRRLVFQLIDLVCRLTRSGGAMVGWPLISCPATAPVSG